MPSVHSELGLKPSPRVSLCDSGTSASRAARFQAIARRRWSQGGPRAQLSASAGGTPSETFQNLQDYSSLLTAQGLDSLEALRILAICVTLVHRTKSEEVWRHERSWGAIACTPFRPHFSTPHPCSHLPTPSLYPPSSSPPPCPLPLPPCSVPVTILIISLSPPLTWKNAAQGSHLVGLSEHASGQKHAPTQRLRPRSLPGHGENSWLCPTPPNSTSHLRAQPTHPCFLQQWKNKV